MNIYTHPDPTEYKIIQHMDDHFELKFRNHRGKWDTAFTYSNIEFINEYLHANGIANAAYQDRRPQ